MNQELSAAELRRLVEQAVTGEATPDDWAQLESQLQGSTAARDYYLDYLNLHAALRRRFLRCDEASDETAADAGDGGQLPAAPVGPSALPWPAALALMVVGMIAAAWPALWPDPALATIRLVEGEVAVVSGRESRSALVGDFLREGESLRVAGESARAALQYRDGTRVQVHSTSVVQAPADGAVSLELLSGSIEVDAPPQTAGRPLVFATEHSRYSVAGTRFRLYREVASTRLELDDGKVRLERPASGETMLVPAGTVAIVDDDETPVRLSPLATGRAELLRSLPRGGQKIAFARDGKSLFASQFDAGLREYRLEDLALLHEYRRHPDASVGIVPLEDRPAVAQLCRNGQFVVWQPGQEEALSLSLGKKDVRSRAISPDGYAVAESSPAGLRVFRLDLAEKKLQPVFQGAGPGKAWCLALSRQGARLAAGFWDGTLRVYDTATGQIQFERRLLHTPTHVELTPDGRRLAVFTQRDGLVCIDLPTGEQHLLWPGGLGLVRALRILPDGSRVLAGLGDNTARMWSVDDARQLVVIEPGYAPQDVAWLETEQILVTAEGGVKFWKCTFDKTAKVIE